MYSLYLGVFKKFEVTKDNIILLNKYFFSLRILYVSIAIIYIESQVS